VWSQGRILMTHPTKAIVGMLLRDFIAVSRGGVDEGLYTAPDLQACCLTPHNTNDLPVT